MGESRLNLCRPKDTSSLQGLLLTTTGLLLELCVRPRGEYFISDPLTPGADFLMIFILLRSLNPDGEEDGIRWGRWGRWATEGETACPPFAPLLLFSDVQWKAEIGRAHV